MVMEDEDWRENDMNAGHETACGLSAYIVAWGELEHQPRAAVGTTVWLQMGQRKGERIIELARAGSFF